MDELVNTIQHGDCIAGMNTLAEGSVDLVFADPPFNIGYDYDVYADRVEHQQYIDWSAEWISAVYRVLKTNGTFWLAIGDDYAAELKIESQRIGFHCRSWVIWYYTFGVNCRHKFTRSHTHLFYFIKDRENFTFRDEDLDNRIPSARELVYNDKRANPKGRLPDDTWIIRPSGLVGELVDDDAGTWSPEFVPPPSDDGRTYTLRPQDVERSFHSTEDTWYVPRVAGTFKERAGFHGCQMPEQVLGRILRTCSSPGELVLDPFSGSATTLAVAKKLGRRFVGFDLSEHYVRYGRERLKSIRAGDRLDGSPEPLKSAKPTPKANAKKGRTKKSKVAAARDEAQVREKHYDKTQLETTLQGITDAFVATHDGFSADRLVADPGLNQAFLDTCAKMGIVGDARIWNTLLFRLRKSGQLVGIPTPRRTKLSWEDCDAFIFASEIAWQSMLNDKLAGSLDEILCDPALAAQFDQIAGALAPGYQSFDYRWAALKLRKEAKTARGRAAILKSMEPRFGRMQPINDLHPADLPDKPGLYILSATAKNKLYIGETLNLRQRLTPERHEPKAWGRFAESIHVQLRPMDCTTAGKLAWQSCLVKKFKPPLNSFELRCA